MTTSDTAEMVKATILACSASLDETARWMLQEADERQATMYRRLVGQVMGGLFTEVLVPIYRAFPDLEPPEIREARLVPREQKPISPALRDSILAATSGVRSQLSELLVKVRALEDSSAAAQLEASLQPILEVLRHLEVFIGRATDPRGL